MFTRIALSLGLLLATTSAFAERDAGVSHNLLIKARLDDRWFLISRSNLASRNDFSDNFLGFTGAGLGYQLNESWSLRAGYRHVWFTPRTDWLEEDRLYAEAFHEQRSDTIRFTSRSRVEFRFFDYQDDDIRLRNEWVVESRAALPGTALTPYVEEEFFYSTDKSRFEANWLGGGVAWRPAKGVKLKLGLRWNHYRVGNVWRDRDVLVTGINLFF